MSDPPAPSLALTLFGPFGARLNGGVLPLTTGTVTFLLTDVEGSTKLWLRDPEAMRHALARHDALLAGAIESHGGMVLKQRGEGDSCFAVFPRAIDAVAAALALQRALLDCGLGIADRRLGNGPPANPQSAIPNPQLKVRVALHTGEAELREGDYYGLAVNHCVRLRAVGHGGQTLLSQTTAALVREALPDGVSLRELGVHRLKDLQRPEPIFQLVHPDLPAEFPPLRSLEAFAHNLPLQLTSFIGRHREMAEVRRLLQTARLLTLTGAGGCGKTRLALQVAADLVEEYPDGVWLVELAALADPALVRQAVVSALGIREEPDRPLIQTLADHLRPKSLLLLLDNCEHLIEAAARLADTLLRTCPGLRILAASREPLGIAGETAWRVPPLSLPPLVDGHGLINAGTAKTGVSAPSTLNPQPSTLMECEAVALFVERATAALPGFTLTAANGPTVAQLCRRLDGIPLALELAAARVKVLSVEQIAARLDDCFRLLTGGSRTALPRQQTLRATIDWSFNLLSEAERTLLRRLWVFAGGWTLEAAEVVCAGEGIEECEVLDLLAQLLQKSMVGFEDLQGAGGAEGAQWGNRSAATQGGPGRYRLLETVRQYARDRLLEAGEAEAARGRHRDWCLALVERAEPELRGPAQAEWLDRLEQEHDNLRAALDWLALRGDVETGCRLGSALGCFWAPRGYPAEGRAYLERFLRMASPSVSGKGSSGPVPAPLSRSGRAAALAAIGSLALEQGDYAAAQPALEESLAIHRELGDAGRTATCLLDLAQISYGQADYPTARTLLDESLRLFRQISNTREVGTALSRLANVLLRQGDTSGAMAAFEEGLTLRRQAGDLIGVAWTLSEMAALKTGTQRHDEAQSYYRECLQIFRKVGLKSGVASMLIELSSLELTRGEHTTARDYCEESLRLFRSVGHQRGIAWALHSLGDAALAAGDWATARARYEETLELQRRLDNPNNAAWAIDGLAEVARGAGDFAASQALFRESLRLRHSRGNARGICWSLEGLGRALAAAGQFAAAARLFGAVGGLRAAMNWPLPPHRSQEHEQHLAPIREALGEAGFTAASAAGQAMSQEQAVSFALEECEISRAAGPKGIQPETT